MKFIVQLMLGFSLFALGCISLFKTVSIGGNIATTIEVYAGGDKMLHFWGAGIISFMFFYVFSHRWSVNRLSFWIMSVLCIEEGAQALFPSRHFNLDDIGAGCLGVLAFGLIFKAFSRSC